MRAHCHIRSAQLLAAYCHARMPAPEHAFEYVRLSVGGSPHPHHHEVMPSFMRAPLSVAHTVAVSVPTADRSRARRLPPPT
eukprot:6488113-Pyramimonas_sp.AAC.1